MASCSIEHPNDSPPVGKLPLLTQSEVIPLATALDYDYTFNWHFRLITYDIPNGIISRTVNY